MMAHFNPALLVMIQLPSILRHLSVYFTSGVCMKKVCSVVHVVCGGWCPFLI